MVTKGKDKYTYSMRASSTITGAQGVNGLKHLIR